MAPRTEPTPSTTPAAATARGGRDRGYSFAELLVTVVLIGVLATIVTAGIRNVTAEAAHSGCRVDARQVELAATAYLEVTSSDSIPPTGDGADRFEHTLVEAGYLRAPSELFELESTGAVVPQEESPC